MGINFGGILGGIAGLLVPGSTFLAPAIGAGLGTLAGGGSFKNAIKYGLLAGGAGQFGAGDALRNSTKIGGILSNQMGKAGLGTAVDGTANKGILSSPFAQAAVLSSIAQEPKPPLLSSEGYDGSSITEKEKEARLDNLYASYNDGTRFSTPEERDEYDRQVEEGNNTRSFETQYAARGGLMGGLIEGPGTGTSDDIPAMIYQDGNPVQEAMLSNGEVVLSLKDLRNIGGGDAEMAGKMIGDAPNGTRGAVAAKLFRNMQEFKNG